MKKKQSKYKYKANFLWPHEEGSVEEAGYEFANAQTEEYCQQWWNILLERAQQQDHLDGILHLCP